MRNKVVFFCRAYNDLDCRLPLLIEFKKDKKYNKVSIIGIPTNKGIYDPTKHDLFNLIKDYKIDVDDIYNKLNNRLILKNVYKLYKLVKNSKRPLINKILEKIKSIIFKVIYYLSVRNNNWIKEIFRNLKSSIIIIDEIAFNKGRSFFVDELMKTYEMLDCSIYSFLTGQDLYLNLWHDTKNNNDLIQSYNKNISLFVPCENDKNVLKKRMPEEYIEVTGNTRFDISWIKDISDIAKNSIKYNELLNRECSHKIVFMLSKIEYGVDLKNIIEAINICSQIEGSIVIVKPHTRGMTLKNFYKKNENVFNGKDLSSTDLIQWAEIVLFTGSSIIIQALQLRKKVIYLKYCQKYKTVYEKSKAVLIVENKNDLYDFINKKNNKNLDNKVKKFLIQHVYNGDITGNVCKNIKNRIEYLEKNGLRGKHENKQN